MNCFLSRLMNVLLVVALVLSVPLVSGCEPLRKKFTRKKKTEQTRDLPVLEPIDYPAKVENPEESLRQQYGLWKIWYGQTETDFAEKSTAKRLRYDLNQLIAQMEETKKFFSGEPVKLLQKYSDRLTRVLAQLDQPPAMWDRYGIKMDLKWVDKEFRANFHPNKIKGSLKP